MKIFFVSIQHSFLFLPSDFKRLPAIKTFIKLNYKILLKTCLGLLNVSKLLLLVFRCWLFFGFLHLLFMT